MVLYPSKDPELYVHKNTDAWYFESVFMVNKESVWLFPEKNIFKRLFKIYMQDSHLGQHTRSIQQNSPSWNFDWNWPSSFEGNVVWKCVLIQFQTRIKHHQLTSTMICFHVLGKYSISVRHISPWKTDFSTFF